MLTRRQVTAFYNGTYATTNSAPEFSVTWQYPQGPITQPVHAFPNIQVGEKDLPVKLSGLQHVYITTEWTYGVGDEAALTTDKAALALAEANTNVAVDMFLDSSEADSTNSSKAAFEVMVWFADFGAAAQPIGYPAVISTQVLNGTTLFVPPCSCTW